MGDEAQESGEISGIDYEREVVVPGGGGVSESGRELPSDHIANGDEAELENDRVLHGVSSMSTVSVSEDWGRRGDREDQFEPVSLKDQERNMLDSQGNMDFVPSSNSDNVSWLSANEMTSELYTGKAALDTYLDIDMQDHPCESPESERRDASGLEQLSSGASFGSSSGFYGETGYSSPVASPTRFRSKPVMPNVSPELLHLVDSAIMGKPESLEKLKAVVCGKESFGRGEEIDCVAVLVVDSLIATMGGVECFDDNEDNNPPSVMLNSRAAIVAGELIPWLPWVGDFADFVSPRTRMVKGLLAILKACTRNRAMCSTAGLLGVLLNSAEKIFVTEVGLAEQMRWDGTPLCHCIQYLAGHSLNVIDLHRWLGVITRTLTTVWAAHLMLALEKAIGGKETRGPACTFEFDGESSGLLGPGESHWPFTNGYAFATWIYIESFAETLDTAPAAASALSAQGTAHMPRLFSFLSADNQGVETYFHAQFLVVESGSGKGKKASLHFTHAFKPQCWYFIGLEHTCRQGLLGKPESELRLYIDGKLYESHPFEFPRISRPLAFCCIGTNPPPTMAGLQHRRRQCPLFAEMGPFYVFKEPVGPEKMSRLASRGGDVLPSFGNGAGLPWLATNKQARSLAEGSALLDAEIGGSLHLLCHPSLLSGRFCPDSSPSGAAGTHHRTAEVLGQVHVATRMRPVESLWAMGYGGPMSLLPLTVGYVQNDTLDPQHGNFPLSLATASLAAPIFRIITIAVQHPGNNEELCWTRGPEVLSRILKYLLQTLSSLDLGKQNGVRDEELVAAIVSLCQSQKNNYDLKVQLFQTLLLDLKMWSLCNYGLRKKLLSSLADMVFTESSAMRDANAIQMLLDGCRRCYWIIREKDSVDTFSLNEAQRPVGEVNALVDELLVVIELLLGAAPPSLAVQDVQCLIGFVIDCPQPNQVARVLHLIYRLVVQPNKSRAQTFADSFITCGGVETLLVLLQREAKAGNHCISEGSKIKEDGSLPHQGSGLDTVIVGSNIKEDGSLSHQGSGLDTGMVGSKIKEDGSLSHQGSGIDTGMVQEKSHEDSLESLEENETILHEGFESQSIDRNFGRMASDTENLFVKNLAGISFSISAESARNNVYNIDNDDGIVVRIINLLGALISSGHLKFGPHEPQNITTYVMGNGLHDGGGTMFSDKVSLLLFALQKAFQAAPERLMTSNAYMALFGASINASSTDDVLNLYDSVHRFEHLQILLVLLRSLPYASRAFQIQTLQDLLFLACSHPENRISLTKMEEWPDWILEVLISNYEMGPTKCSNGASLGDIEDIVHNFLIIMLEHSMQKKDGWKDIEATIHCAEWLSMVGGSSTGDHRIRREESLPIFKRRLLGGLLDFAARELRVQTHVMSAAAAGVAIKGLPPKNAKAEADTAAQLSVALAENAIVILMLVEDHLRLQSQLFISSHSVDTPVSPSSSALTIGSRSKSLAGTAGESSEDLGTQRSLSSYSGGLSLDVLASMADANGQISAAEMECLTVAASAEPYASVRCAFASYGSCALDIAEGWNYRSRLWYGVGLSSKNRILGGGGGSGWESWSSVLEKDANGNWIELPLVKKSVTMLEALLLDESGLSGSVGIGGKSGTGMGRMTALYQLLDSDQPFLCMLRMALVSMREEDGGDDGLLMTNVSIRDDDIPERLNWQAGNVVLSESNSCLPTRKPQSALLWSVLSPVLNMPISESRRQRVLVVSSVLYSEVWHAVSKDKKPLRKQYMEAILPPYVAILRRWRPLLAGIHELTSPDGVNPLMVDDRALAADALPLEAALSMISPGWAAAFASPPAAMALAMIAAGATGGEAVTPVTTKQLFRRDTSLIERKTVIIHKFSSFQKPLETPNIKKTPAVPKDKAAAKAAALAAARDLERRAKIGSGRGLSAVAMATSAQRRSVSDMERVKRWNMYEAMGTAWMECLQSVGTKSVSGKDLNALFYKYVAVLVTSFALARNRQRSEIDRRVQVDVIDRHRLSTGARAWRKLIHYLIELKGLFGPLGEHLCNPERVFWKLDTTESSSRMRICLRRNYRGYDRLGAAANYEENLRLKHNQQNAVSTSTTSILVAEAILMEQVNEDHEHTETDNLECRTHDREQRVDNQQSPSSTFEQPVQIALESVNAQVSDRDLVQNMSDVAPGYVPGELDERIILELSSSMVRPLRVIRGTFQVTTKRINFTVDDQTVEDSLSPSSGSKYHEKNWSWLMSSLHQIFSRRYLLRRSALELFMVDRTNFFIDFGSTEGWKIAYRAIVQARPPCLYNIYLATQRPEQLLKRSQLMERWAKWEISNFEYLMQLNTLAGRSYNDITQYPIFPWILADYTSKTLDLSNPSSFRDLSKPIGALNADRLKKFQQRYSSFDDPVIPKYHYGSHYSSAGTVLYYLFRVEPFTTLSIQLQGGKFDHADRMFSDIAATWDCVLEDMSDVKELVPELFYLPEALTNVNFIDFGTTQLGGKLDSVQLPPWAENPVDFIHKHRMALESEHVSAHLHEWIDLIFGYKQRGKEAILADNVFFYVTYEGTVDIDKITDPAQQRATQDQIVYFGQTPSQLLTAPHLKKQPLADVLHLQTIFSNPREVRPYIVPNPERCNVPAAAIHASPESVIIVDFNAPAAHVALHKWQPKAPDGQGTPFLFQHGKAVASSNGGAFMRMFKGPAGSGFEEWQFPQALAFAASGIRSSALVSITCDEEIITGGHADNSVKLISSDGARTIETATGHCAPVTCLALSADSNCLVTGSRDTTVILWRVHRASASHSSNISDPTTSSGAPTYSSSGHLANTLADSSQRLRIEGPIHVLRGHLSEITCCCVSSDLAVVASCANSSNVLLHSIAKGRLITRLVGVEAHSLCLSSRGVLMTWNKSEQRVSTFTVNGIPIATAQLSSGPISISCMEVSVDGENALIAISSCLDNDGTNNTSRNVESNENEAEGIDLGVNRKSPNNRLTVPVPSICFLDLHSLKVFHTLKLGEGQDITAMALNKDNTNLLVSTADKKLIVFTYPALGGSGGSNA